MRRSFTLAAAPLIALGLLVPTAPAPAASPTPAAAAIAVEPLVVTTVNIGGKRVRFVLAVDSEEKAYVRMKLRRDGRWRTVDSDRTECRYYEGSSNPGLEVQKPDRQVLVTWAGPNPEQVAAEYGGYNVRRNTIDMFGVDEDCPAAG